MVIPNADASSADVYFLDLAAKLDQTAEFECGTKWAIARSPAALGLAVSNMGSSKVNIDAGYIRSSFSWHLYQVTYLLSVRLWSFQVLLEEKC